MTKIKQFSSVVGAAVGSVLISQAAYAGGGCNHAMKTAGYDSAYSNAVYQPMRTSAGQQMPARAYQVGMGYGSKHSSTTNDNASKPDIVDTAISAGSFDTLVTAIKAAGLVETLKGKGPFTVFAPTDAAFAKLPKGQLNALLADKKALTKVLTYHVVAGQVKAEDVVKLSSASTVEGQSVKITVGDSVMVNNANVTKTDIMTSNGVIHVIDSVILPPDMVSKL
jgi:uncharacterized surface protein with fasciclin (FAS1) repeats